jgi:hypothetical protein
MNDDENDDGGVEWAVRFGLVAEKNRPPWAADFRIQSTAELDFVLESRGWPIGMSRQSPAEFRRRVFAAALSYHMTNKSIDYTLKRYVAEDQFDNEKIGLGDAVSDQLARCNKFLSDGMKRLHTPEPSFGVFGAEITLYRIPHVIEVARMLANRGLLLEVLPMLRLVVEMAAWASTAFYIEDESKVIDLSASNCVSKLKRLYPTTGKIYGHLSTFSHWGHAIHSDFLFVEPKRTSVVFAAIRYRARALALCAVTLDLVVEVVRSLYSARSDDVVSAVQQTLARDHERKLYSLVSQIAELTQLPEVREVLQFLPNDLRP